MIKRILSLLLIGLLTFAGFTSAQQINPVKDQHPSSEKTITHIIEKRETIFSICKKYDIDQTDLLKANPTLKDGLKTGQTIIIPQKNKAQSVRNTHKNTEEEFINHTVTKGETPFSISKQYKVPIETIIKFNPDAKDGIKTGQILKIPGFANEAAANQVSVANIVNTEKKNFIEYEVEEGDTFYGLLRKFGITKDQLLTANPGMAYDIKVGQLVRIPSVDESSKKKESNSKHIEHNVEPGETIYGLSTEYGIKVFELMEENPGLEERGLVSGETIFIPRNAGNVINNTKKESPKTKKETAFQSRENGNTALANSRDTFNIALFLPLFLRENQWDNNTDSSSAIFSTAKKRERSLYNHSRNFLFFYEGFLVALDSMKKTGINIKVDVHDSQFKQHVVDSVIRQPKFLNTDLIVGPVDVKHQKNISSYSYKNQIPLVSPFSSDNDFMNTNPFYFQINPPKDYIYRKTADYIGRTHWDKNVILLTPYSYEQISGGDIVELVREKLKFYSEKNNGGSIEFSKISISDGYYEVKDNLKKDRENIIFILPPSSKTEREAILSRAINNLYTLSENFDITLYGMSEYTNYKSINAEYFHKLKLHYLTPNFIDYSDPEVNYFIKNFREKFNAEPNQFSYRGYDIAKFFLEAYRTHGKNYLDKVSSLDINTLQSGFKMKRAKEFSGFMNQTIYVVSFTSDYEVKIASKITD